MDKPEPPWGSILVLGCIIVMALVWWGTKVLS